MPETETTWEQAAAEDPELFEWYDDATRALSEAVREHIARYSIEHPPPPRPLPVRLELTKEIRFLSLTARGRTPAAAGITIRPCERRSPPVGGPHLGSAVASRDSLRLSRPRGR